MRSHRLVTSTARLLLLVGDFFFRTTSFICLPPLVLCFVAGAASSSFVGSDAAGQPDSGTIVAAVSGKAVLPCPVEKPLNDSVDLILWFRGESETALYSLDARAGSFQRARHFPSDDLSSRAFIDITGRPTSLVIENIKSDDAGLYKCRVDFRRARTQFRIVHLSVVVPPKQVIIMNENGELLSSSSIERSQKSDSIGPYNERAHLTLVCEAEGGIPSPRLRWLKDGVTIDESWTVTPQGIARNELVITRLSRSDLMSVLSCEAVNSNLTAAAATSITLDLNLRPLSVRITSLRRPFSAGKRVQVSCESSGSRPAAVVTWWLGSKQLTHVTEEVSSLANTTSSTAHYTPLIEDNGKVLSCRSDHSILPDSALEDSWLLDIYYIPKLTLEPLTSLHHGELEEGKNVTLICHVDANPPASQISWQMNGHLVTADPGIIIANFSLTLSGIGRQHSGKYSCISANVEGEGISNQILLKVLYAPVCRVGQKKLFGVATREPVQVSCEVDADPPQVSFHWSLNNSFEVLPIKNIVNSKLRSVALYAPRTKFGFGQLVCVATNKVGMQRTPCYFDLIPAGPPQPVRNCLVGNQSMDSLVVRCEAGDDGGLKQVFHLEVYHSGRGSLHSNLTANQSPIFDVHDLPMSTPFVLVVFGANAKGRSHSMALSASTLPLSNKEVNVITPLVAVLIGIVGSLVVTAVVVIFVTRCKTRHKMEPEKRSANPSEGEQECEISHEERSDTCDGSSHWRSSNGSKLKMYQSGEPVDDLWAPVVRQENDYYFEEKARSIHIPASQDNISLSLQMSDCLPSRSRGSQCLFPTRAVIKDSTVVLLNQDVIPALERGSLLLPTGASAGPEMRRSGRKDATLSTPV